VLGPSEKEWQFLTNRERRKRRSGEEKKRYMEGGGGLKVGQRVERRRGEEAGRRKRELGKKGRPIQRERAKAVWGEQCGGGYSGRTILAKLLDGGVFGGLGSWREGSAGVANGGTELSLRGGCRRHQAAGPKMISMLRKSCGGGGGALGAFFQAASRRKQGGNWGSIPLRAGLDGTHGGGQICGRRRKGSPPATVIQAGKGPIRGEEKRRAIPLTERKRDFS